MPIPGLKISPAQIMFNRRVKTKIPVHTKLLQPAIPRNVHHKLSEKQIQTKNYYDLHVKKREQFQEGENVLVRTGKVWEPAKIISKHNTPRSYIIINSKGNMVRRNSSHLKKTKTEFKINSYDEDFDDRTKNNENRKQEVNVERNEFTVPDKTNIANEEQSQIMKTTRSGRRVKPPAKLREYIL